MFVIINENKTRDYVMQTYSYFSAQFEKSEDAYPESCLSGKKVVGEASGVSMLNSPRTMLSHRAYAVGRFRVSVRCQTTSSAICILKKHL